MTMLMNSRRHLGGASGPITSFKYVAAGQNIPSMTFTGGAGRAYFDVSGILQTAGSNVLRASAYFGGNIGIWYEPNARTNSVLDSDNLAAASWTDSLCTIGGSITGIDGTAGVTTLGIIGTNAVNTLVDGTLNVVSAAGYTVTASTNQAFNFFAKPGNKSNFIFQNRLSDGATFHTSWVNVSTGAVGTKNANHTIKTWPLGNGWYWIQVREASSGAGAAANIIAYGFVDADNSHTLTGDGATVNGYVQRVGYEIDAAWPSSPIFTSGGTATRAAESLTWPHNSVPQSRTLYIKYTNIGSPSNLANSLFAFRIAVTGAASLAFTNSTTGGNFSGRVTNASVASASNAALTSNVGDIAECNTTGDNAVVCVCSAAVNGGATTVGAAGATIGAYQGSYSDPNYGFAAAASGSGIHILAMKDVLGVQTMATMRAI